MLKVSKATKEDVDKAFESSNKAYKAWRQWSHKDRAELLLRVAAIILVVEEISAVMVYEAGKPWDEAVGDAAEGIDFIEYYARSMMELADGKPVLDREENITSTSINQLVLVLQFHLGTSICNYGWYNSTSCCW